MVYFYKCMVVDHDGSRISGKGVRRYNGMGVPFPDFLSPFP